MLISENSKEDRKIQLQNTVEKFKQVRIARYPNYDLCTYLNMFKDHLNWKVVLDNYV